VTRAHHVAALLLPFALACGGGASKPDAGGAAGTGGVAGGNAGGAGSFADGSAGAGGTTVAKDAGADTALVDAGPSSTRQTAHLLGTNGAPNGFYEYLPPGYDDVAPAPLLVFWHGIGEDGNGTSDLSHVLSWGPPKLIANNKWDATRPFIVLSPQYTAVNGNIAPGGGCPSSATIHAFLTWAVGHYKVDAKRVYLTGLSCGAIGSWDYVAEHTGTVVAAAVLLSGNPGDPTVAGSAWKRAMCGLGTVALWSLHGDADTTVPYAPDHDTVDLIKACPAPPRREAKFTDIVAGGHLIWDPIYDLSGGSGDIYAWFLANAKP
jgi:poly(3-hydroxybutyrate) depolymerase